MVLANGKHMFSCSGDGSYNLDVALDGNGEITLFSFVSGLAPFQQTFQPAQLVDYTINMAASGAVPEFTVAYTAATSIRDGWVDLIGALDKDGTPVCALVLANGQHMFSCSGDGSFNLEVPTDANDRITLFSFASGHQPYKQTLLTSADSHMTISSISYENNATIPSDYACTNLGGQNTTPQISWADLPMEATSLAIIMDDEDNPCGTGDQACIHWNVFNIPTSAIKVCENQDLSAIDGVTQGTNYASTIGYEGPCPPWTHTYKLAVYALSDSMPVINQGAAYTRSQFETNFAAYILDSALLTGSFTPPN